MLILGLLLTSLACGSAVRFTSSPSGGAIKSGPQTGTQGGTSAGGQTHSGNGNDSPNSEGIFRGIASYYGEKFHGRLTANGETFDQNEMTAAHKSLAFGTVVRVKHVANGREVIVRINDRGPFVKGRVIDLSRAAADKLGMIREGVAMVEVTIIQ